MIWTVLKADILYTLLTLPLLVGVNVIVVLVRRRQAKRAWPLARPACDAKHWKLWQMRVRRSRRVARASLPRCACRR